MTNSFPPTSSKPMGEQVAAAKKELDKLPLLGPAAWLFARDQHRRFTFFADIDWRLMPPLVLNQCRLFSREGLPWAFVTWAFVSPVVDQRMRTTSPIISPAEWKSGDIPWLIDVVTPFGNTDEIVKELVADIAPAKTVSAWIFDEQGKPQLREIRPVQAAH